MSAMDMKPRFSSRISCHLNPEYFNKINNLTRTFLSRSSQRSGTRKWESINNKM